MLWISFAIINFIIVLFFFKRFGKTGLFVWIGFATVAANIEVAKTVELFGLTSTLGNIMYGSVFLRQMSSMKNMAKKKRRKPYHSVFSSLSA